MFAAQRKTKRFDLCLYVWYNIYCVAGRGCPSLLYTLVDSVNQREEKEIEWVGFIPLPAYLINYAKTIHK